MQRCPRIQARMQVQTVWLQAEPLPMLPFWMSSLVCKGGAAGLVAALRRVALELTRNLGVRPSPKHCLAHISCWDPELSWESLALGMRGLSLPPWVFSPEARGEQDCGKSCAVMTLVVQRTVSALRACSCITQPKHSLCFPLHSSPGLFCLAPVSYRAVRVLVSHPLWPGACREDGGRSPRWHLECMAWGGFLFTHRG